MHNNSRRLTAPPHTRLHELLVSGDGREVEGKRAVQCLEISVSQLTGVEESVAPLIAQAVELLERANLAVLVLFSLLSTTW